MGILVYAVIAPASPRKMLLAALIAASMDPLALWLAYLMGDPVATIPHAVILSLPNFSCALIASLPARLLHRLGKRLREAQELGSYQLVRPLGQGGMGEVWEARHRLLARGAAIKLVRPEVLGARNEAEARVMLRRFEREAQATASLSSPHTIDVFDFGVTDEGTFYYVMELLAGRDLETLVREFGPVSAERTAFLLRQVCHSLADAHARGMVHRDIKPANIYVCRMGLEYDFVKVLDFGLVKLRERSGDTESLLTLDHTTTGTPAYMAPEIILGDADVDSRADVYALGCVAYYLLTGQLVFEAETPMKMLMQHVHTQPVPPSQRTELPDPAGARRAHPGVPAERPEHAPAERGDPASHVRRCPRLQELERRCREAVVGDAPAGSHWSPVACTAPRLSPLLARSRRSRVEGHDAESCRSVSAATAQELARSRLVARHRRARRRRGECAPAGGQRLLPARVLLGAQGRPRGAHPQRGRARWSPAMRRRGRRCCCSRSCRPTARLRRA